MRWNKVSIGEFLEERKDRFKPEVANSLNLKRISKIDFSGNIHIDENKPTKTNMILIKNGDLVISGINADKGAVAIYTGKEDVMATIHYSSYSFDSKKINVEYLKWYLKSKTFLEILKKQTKGGIKTELKAKKLLPLIIELPNLFDQKKILNKINSINIECNDLYNVQTELLISIAQLKQAILQEAIQGKLTSEWRKQNPDIEPASELLKRIKAEKAQLIKEKKIKKEKALPSITKEETFFDLPESWSWCRLQDVTTLITDGKHGNCIDEENSGYYFLSAKDIQNGQLIYNSARQINYKEFQEVHNRTNLEPLDLCIVNTGGTVGKTAIVKDTKNTPKTTFQKSVAVVKPIKKYFNTSYLNFFIIVQTPNLLKTSRGSAINNLLLGDMKKVCLPFPPLEEQKSIVEKVETLIAHCDALEQEIKQSEQHANMLMQAVLKEAFEGGKVQTV